MERFCTKLTSFLLCVTLSGLNKHTNLLWNLNNSNLSCLVSRQIFIRWWHYDQMMLWHYGIMALWPKWHYGIMTTWCYGIMTKLHYDQNDIMALWPMTLWPNDVMALWPNDVMALWPNDIMALWPNEIMALWPMTLWHFDQMTA